MYTLRKRGIVGPNWPRPDGMPEIVHQLLRTRGVESERQARVFLHPLEQPLHDPYLFPGISQAAPILRSAIAQGMRICVYGDYDADGVCASAILCGALEALGADVVIRIPTRAEGYGLNEEAVRELAAQGVGLLVTVDCGITARENVRIAQSLGMQVVVTDHHRADPELLPNCAIVSSQMGEYPSPYLCGAGVAFKLCCALDSKFEEEYIDLAAIATVADIVPALGENRVIIAKGLQKLNASPRPCVQALMDAAGISGRKIDEGTIGFQIAPRINAAGRLGSAMRSFELLRTKSLEEAAPLARVLNEENVDRKRQGSEIEQEAAKMLENYDFTAHRAIVLKGKWNPGIVGISASHLKEEYQYPVILLCEQEGRLHGSCRSIDGVDIYDALSACAEHLTSFGGHVAAAGLSMPAENFDAFRDCLDTYLRENIPPEMWIPAWEYDADLGVCEADVDLCRAVEKLAPFGLGNPPPVFLTQFRATQVRTMGKGVHLKFDMQDDTGDRLEAVYFKHGDLADELALGTKRMAVGALEINSFMNTERVQFNIAKILPENARNMMERAKMGYLSQSFLTEILYTNQNKEGQMIDLAAAVALLCENLQGVTFAFGCAKAAWALYDALVAADIPYAPDIVFDDWAQDERCFSCISVCPAGKAPKGVKIVIAGDIDAKYFAQNAPDAKLYQLTGADCSGEWLESLPDVDELRNVYVAARRLFSRPLVLKSRGELRREVAKAADVPEHSALAALMALEDMGLVTYRENPIGLDIPRGIKADPMQNGIVRNILALRERGSLV